jgi:hypothetical protein
MAALQIPTALQQRLQWKPKESGVFRQLSDFNKLLEVYSFASGSRYKIAPASCVKNERKERNLVCTKCPEGRIELRIQRRNATCSCWIVRRVKLCGCGKPSSLLRIVKKDDRTLLVGKYTKNPKNWKALAHACFPAGYKKVSRSMRYWALSCQSDDCPGRLRFKGEKYKERRYSILAIDCGINCSAACKARRTQSKPIAAHSKPIEQVCCPLCYEDDLTDWIVFPCGKDTCVECLQKLVRSCPPQLSVGAPCLERFEPNHNEKHFHECPFCKAAYRPQTQVQRHRVLPGSGTNAKITTVEVSSLVPIAYAYQSFTQSFPAFVETAAEYAQLQHQYQIFLQARRTQQRETEEDIFNIVQGLSDENFGRLQGLQQSTLFQRHEHEVLNFLDAVEALHDRQLDWGFLQRVADANGNEARSQLMNTAYREGWYVAEENVDERLILVLLQRKELLELIDLVSDSDSDKEDESV